MGHADHGTHQKENTKERIQKSTKARIDETNKTEKHDFGKGRNLDSTQPDTTSLWYTEKGHLWSNKLMWYNGPVKREGLTFIAQRPRATNRRCIGTKSTAIKRESRTRLTKYARNRTPARMTTIPATPTIRRRIDRPEPGASVIDICHLVLLRGCAARTHTHQPQRHDKIHPCATRSDGNLPARIYCQQT